MISGPSDAELARTLLASSRVATVTTYPARPPRPQRTTAVGMSEGADGRPVVRLTPGAPAVADLTARPLATVTVAPAGYDDTLVVQGAARLVPGEGSPLLAYRVEAAGVRLLGTPGGRVDVDAYRCAEPDPLRDLASPVLAHLAANHGEDLTGCLRAQGMAAVEWVHPRRLDRYGLQLVAVDGSGVASVRLPFPRPLAQVGELDPGLRSLLCCRCRRAGPRSPGRACDR